MIFRCVFIISLCVVLTLGEVRAQTYMAEDFEDGDTSGWIVNPGRGVIGLSEYAGNRSLRMGRNASAFHPIELAGARRIKISAAFAAVDLEGSDACILEFSEDGATWIEIGRIEDGEDDGLTLHSVSRTVDLSNAASKIYIGVRVKGNADNDTCWVDNISVVAVASAMKTEIVLTAFADGLVDEVPFSTAAFFPPDNATAPNTALQGVLRFAGGKADHFRLIKDDFGYVPGSNSVQVLPPVEIEFVQIDDEIVPVTRGPRLGSHPDWEWIVEPGRIWREPDGAIRASFPFALQERNANCIHNGLAAFRIDEEGELKNVVYQIGSETCAYMQFDLWGAGPASFERRNIASADAVSAAYKQEKQARLKVQPLTTLDSAGDGAFGSPEEVRPDAMTAFGYVEGDIHFVGGCETRYGLYPFCDVLDLPSYSWAKSIVAGMAAMRLEKLYPGAMSSLITDYVSECDGGQWENVTFAHALNMATGIYASDIYDEDERSPPMRRFFLSETHTDKIAIACRQFPKQATPGSKFVYRTTDTYVLGAAMNEFLRTQTGDLSSDLFYDLLAPIFRSLSVSPLLMETRRTLDEARHPFTGWGLTMHRNDIALVAGFLQNGGVIDGEALLDEAMLAAALQRAPQDRGLPAVIDTQRYKNGFWAWNAGPAIGCADEIWIPAMSGYGGLSAALMPNGATYYYVSDGGDFAWRRAAQASNARDAFCEIENDQ